MLSIPFLCLRAAQNYPRGPLRHALVPGKQVAATGRELASNGSACFARRFALLSPVAAEASSAAAGGGAVRELQVRSQKQVRVDVGARGRGAIAAGLGELSGPLSA